MNVESAEQFCITVKDDEKTEDELPLYDEVTLIFTMKLNSIFEMIVSWPVLEYIIKGDAKEYPFAY